MTKKRTILEDMKDRKHYDKQFQIPIGRLSEKMRKESEYWLAQQKYELADDIRDISAQLSAILDNFAKKYLNPETQVFNWKKYL